MVEKCATYAHSNPILQGDDQVTVSLEQLNSHSHYTLSILADISHR